MFQKEDSKHFFQKLIHPGGCEKTWCIPGIQSIKYSAMVNGAVVAEEKNAKFLICVFIKTNKYSLQKVRRHFFFILYTCKFDGATNIKNIFYISRLHL